VLQSPSEQQPVEATHVTAVPVPHVFWPAAHAHVWAAEHCALA
jgi:hypothetical protein